MTEKNPFSQFDEKKNPFAQFDQPAVARAPAEALPQVSPWEASKLGRLVQGMAEPVYGAGQLAAHLTGVGTETMDRAVKEREARYQASRLAAGIGPQDWDYMSGLGNILSPVNYLPGAAVGRVLGRATTLAGRLGEGALTGAGMGAFNPVNEPGDNFAERKAEQVGVGAAAGALSAPVAHLTSQAIAPEIEPGVRRLAAEGWEPTIGQVFGPGSIVRRAEEAGSKVPGIGAFIRGREEAGLESSNRIVANRALRPVGLELPKTIPAGYDAAEVVADELGHVYDDVHQHMTFIDRPQAVKQWQRVAQFGKEVLPDTQQKRLEQIIQQQLVEKPLNYVSSKHGAYVMDGAGIQKIHSVLAHLERGYRKSADPDIQSLGELVGLLRNEFNNELERQNPLTMGPGAYINNRMLPPGTTLNDVRRLADEGWAHYVRMRDASASAASMARNGVFTPNTYAQSVRKGAATPGQMARGQALDQQLANDMKRFIPANLGDSGTTERAMWGALLGGGAMISPQTAALAATIPALYSNPIQNFLVKAALAPRGTVARAVGRTVPDLGTRAGAEGVLSSTDTSPRPAYAGVGQDFAARALARQYSGQ